MRNVDLVMVTVKINLTSLSTSDTNSFWDAFDDYDYAFNCYKIFYSNLFFIIDMGQNFQLRL